MGGFFASGKRYFRLVEQYGIRTLVQTQYTSGCMQNSNIEKRIRRNKRFKGKPE